MKPKGMFLSWVVVKDFDAAVKFYTDVIGFKLLQLSPEYGWAELAGPEGSRLGIAQQNPQDNIQAGSNAVTTISVDDIQASKEELQKRGVRLMGETIEVPGHVKMQSFIDQDGNMLQLVEELT
jgi:predicted enzyme related to lactoylglutathione lyase